MDETPVALVTVIVLTRASMLPVIASGDDGPVRVEVRHARDEAALRALVDISATAVVLMDVSDSGAQVASDCRRIADLMPTCARVGYVYSVRLLTRWHLDALCRGQLHAIVDAFVPPTDLREVLIAASHGAMVLRVTADPNHTMMLAAASVGGSIDVDALGEDDRIVALSALGWSEREIGSEVHLSASAVHHRLERVRARLGLRNRIELAAWAGHVGFYSPQRDDETAASPPLPAGTRARSDLRLDRAPERHHR